MTELRFYGKRWRYNEGDKKGKFASKKELINFLNNSGYKVINRERVKTSRNLGLLKMIRAIESVYYRSELTNVNTNTSKTLIEYRVWIYSERKIGDIHHKLEEKMDELLEKVPSSAVLVERNREENEPVSIDEAEGEEIGLWIGTATFTKPNGIRYVYRTEGDPFGTVHKEVEFGGG